MSVIAAFQVIIFELFVKCRRIYIRRKRRRCVCGISSNDFRTLYDMPTDLYLYPSVGTLVIMAFQVIILCYKIYHSWSINISSNYFVIVVAFQVIISSNKYFVLQNIWKKGFYTGLHFGSWSEFSSSSSSIELSSPSSQSSIWISSSSSTFACPLELKIKFNSYASTSTRLSSKTRKFEFFSNSIEGAIRYGSINSLIWKTSSRILVSSFSSWTTSTQPRGFVFKTNNQSTLDRSFLNEGVYM